MSELIGIISDAHGNREAFNKGVEVLLSHGAKKVYFLGDALGYIPSLGVLDSLKNLGDTVRCIKGNHEAMLLRNGLDPAKDRVYQLGKIRAEISQAQLSEINSWPEMRTEIIDKKRLMFVHGSPTNPTFDYIYPDTDLSTFNVDFDWVFMGNTHYPFVREHSGTVFVNVGSCGMPRDDGRYGSAALLDTACSVVKILRFNITAETDQALKDYPFVHESVRELGSRRQAKLEGNLV